MTSGLHRSPSHSPRGLPRTGAYCSLVPFVGAAVSLAIARERPSVLFLLGAGFMGGGAWLRRSERHEHEHRHEPMPHGHAHVHDGHRRHAHEPGDPPVTDPVPHAHPHRHVRVTQSHAHYPDLHHRHDEA